MIVLLQLSLFFRIDLFAEVYFLFVDFPELFDRFDFAERSLDLPLV